MTALTRFSLLFVLLTAPALAITLTCNPPASVTVGVYSSMPCSAYGGIAPFGFQISGNLPPGLSQYVSGNGFSIQGTPTVAGTYPFTVIATDSANNTTSVPYTITVAAGSSGPVTLTSVAPSALTAGVPYTLTLTGTNFTTSSIVYFNGTAITPAYSSSTLLYAAIPASLVTAGNLPVYIHDPTNGTSGTLFVTVTGSGGVSLSSLSPTSIATGSGQFTLTLFGSGFSSGALVTFGPNCTVSSTYVSSSELTAIIPASCITVAGTVNVSVAGSNSVPFTIGSSGGSGGITLTSLSPTTLTAGTTTTLYLYGTNFTPNTQVHFNGYVAAVNYQSSTTVYVTIPAAYVTSGSLPVYLTDPTYGTSNTLYVTVSGGTGIITLTQVSPSTLTPSTGASLILTGTNFTFNSLAYFNGIAVQTQYVNSTELIATIPATLVTPGTLPIFVYDPTNGTSGTLYVTVTGGSSSLTAISPTNATINSGPLTLTIFGSGFSSGALLNFGSNCTVNTTFINSTQLHAVIPNSCLTTPQTVNVTVGLSNALAFVIGPGTSLPITCSPSTGPATLNVDFTQTCFVTTGTAPYTWFVSGLPAGLSQSAYNGGSTVSIAGTPNTDQTYTYTVQVTDSTIFPSRLTGSLSITGTVSGAALTSLSPQTIAVGSATTNLTVSGIGFTAASIVYFNGSPLSTTFVSSTQLHALIPATDLTTAQYPGITVNTSGNFTNALLLVIAPAGSSPLTMSCMPGIGPQTLGANFTITCIAAGGGQPYTWTVPGLPSYLTPSATTGPSITMNGTPQSAGSYNFTVNVADASSPVQTAMLQIAGLVTSAVNNGSVTLTSLSPASTPVGSAGFTLNVFGSGFTSASQVLFDGFSVATTFVSSIQLQAVISPALLTYAHAAQVTVFTLGDGTSNALAFMVGSGGPNPVSMTCIPGIGPVTADSSYSSTCTVSGGTGPYFWTITAGAVPPGLTLTPSGITAKISGYNYANGPYSYTLRVADSSSPQNVASVVFAGTTAIANNGIVTLNSVSPNSLTPSASARISLIGSNFTGNSLVYFNGIVIAPLYVSSTDLILSIPGVLVTPGTLPVYITDPANGTTGTMYVSVGSGSPTLNSISPTSTPAGSSAFTLTLFGTGFSNGLLLSFGANCTVTTTFISSSQLTAAIPPACLTTPQTVNVSVGGSNPQQFVISAALTLSSLSPSILTAGTAATLYFYGTNFTPYTLVHFNGLTISPTYVNSTMLYVNIPGAYVTAGSLPVYLTDPVYGTSNTLYATVPALTLTSLSPATVPVGSASFTLTLNGTGFTSGLLLSFGSVCTLSTTFVNSTQLQATIPASCLTTAQTLNVSVGSSNSLPFVINSTITLSEVSPTTLPPGYQATLYLCGTNFTPNSIVHFNNTPVATFFLDSGSLVATVPYELVNVGTFPVYVSDPATGTSAMIYISVPPAAGVTLTVLSPTTLTAGHAVTLNLTGTGFTPSSIVFFNGTPVASTYMGAMQLSIQLPAGVVTAGTFPVDVYDPVTVFTSNVLLVTVN